MGETLTVDQAIDHLIKNGYVKTRRQARKMLAKAVLSGDLPMYGSPVHNDGSIGPVQRVPIP